MKIWLPGEGGALYAHTPGEPRAHPRPSSPLTSRIAYAAAHVVADPFADNTPGSPAAVDWEATLAFRRHLWAYGLGVAEAMDTAQRGMGLDWPAARELIGRSGAEARACGGRIVCGAGTDQLGPGPAPLDRVIAAYEEQLAVVEDAGAIPVIMASRQLAAAARGPDDYAEVYGRLLGGLRRPAVLHWLGPMFDPALAGYWGSPDPDAAADLLLSIIEAHPGRVDGVKVSLLDAGREVALRRRLPAGVRMYTGDDFHYPELIAGDGSGHSDALLGIFDVIAPAASAALQALDADAPAAFREILAPTVPLARAVFAAPTRHYKTGAVFLAWLAGHQRHFRMVGGMESARSVPHLAGLYRLADAAGLLPDPELAVTRLRSWLAVQGVER
ncbi:Protein of unknown function [Thermomonospora echinospora]|uniref:Dihydrodipicolinate synthase/N-acetylneuraminate lyase n=1 Tax=Thermomonospora echinospora TaxID=1992 RepID=A0A1H5TKT4_9ACTN|nr:Protein of unknown function [Thermomonospora echinospora]